jgi:hypothetical protein
MEAPTAPERSDDASIARETARCPYVAIAERRELRG